MSIQENWYLLRRPRRERKIMREILPLAVICTTLNTRIRSYGNIFILILSYWIVSLGVSLYM